MSSELSGAIVKRLPHAKNQLSVTGFININLELRYKCKCLRMAIQLYFLFECSPLLNWDISIRIASIVLSDIQCTMTLGFNQPSVLDNQEKILCLLTCYLCMLSPQFELGDVNSI